MNQPTFVILETEIATGKRQMAVSTNPTEVDLVRLVQTLNKQSAGAKEFRLFRCEEVKLMASDSDSQRP